MPPSIDIGPPKVLVGYMVVFSTIWTAYLAPRAWHVRGHPAALLPTLLMLVVMPAFGYRLATQRIRADDDELLIRDTFRTRRWNRSSIVGFRLQPTIPWGPSLVGAVFAPGEDIVQLPALGPPYLRRKKANVLLEELRAWRAAG